MEIRRAVAADAPGMAGVLTAAFAAYEPAYTPTALAATTPPAGRITARLQEGPGWVALDGTTPVGTVAAVLRGDVLYMRSMAVLPAARGQGVGEALLRAVECWAREAGATAILLSTTPFLLSAIRLYARYGFQTSDQGPHDLSGTPLVSMVLPLRPAAR